MITFNTKQVAKNATSRDLENLSADCPEVKLQEKTTTQNGEVTPDTGFDGLSKVTVDVDLEAPYNQGIEDQKAKLTDIEITQNGSYTRSDGYKQVDVNIPLQEKEVNVLLSDISTEVLPDAGYEGISKLTVTHSPVESNTAYEATSNGSYTITPTEGFDATTSVNLTVNVPEVKLQGEKSIIITENGDTNIEPDETFDAIKKVVVTTNVDLQTPYNNGYSAGKQDQETEDLNKLTTKDITANGSYTADYGFSSVNVNVPSKEEETTSVSYTANGTYTVQPTEGKTLSEVSVDVNVPISGALDISQPYVSLSLQDFTADNFNALTGYENLTSVSTKFRYMQAVKPSSTDDVTVTLDLPNVVDASYFLSNLTGGSSQYKINLSFTERSFKKCEKFYWFMSSISNVTFLNPNVDVDLSNGISLDYCYFRFGPEGNVTCKANISSKCTSLRNFGELSSVNFDWTDADTSNVESFYYFLSRSSVTDIPLFDCSKATNINSMLQSCYKLTNVGGFLNLGKSLIGGYSSKLDLSYSSKLTTESVLNIFNNLYSVDSTLGCAIALDSTVYSNLTEEQIAIATNKGWTINQS